MIPALRSRRQDEHRFKANMSYMVRPERNERERERKKEMKSSHQLLKVCGKLLKSWGARKSDD